MFNNNKGLPAWRMLSLVLVVTFGVLAILGTGFNNDPYNPDPQDIANAGPDQYVGANSTLYLDGSGSNTALGADPGNNKVVYDWEIVELPADTLPTVWMSATNIVNPRFFVSSPGEYIIQLTVIYSGYIGRDKVKITVYSEYDEIPPVARAGDDIVTKHGALVELNASDSLSFYTRQNSKLLSFSWYMSESPLESTSALSSTEGVNPSFIADRVAGRTKSHYEVRLHVIDDNGWVSTPDHIDVYVYPSEGYVHPTPIAGPDQRVSTGTQVILDGSESFDVDGRPLSHEWQFYSRPQGSRAVLSNANTPTPSFTPDIDGAYVLFLSVDNGEYNSSSDLIDDFNQSLYDRQYQDRVTVIATFPQPVPILGPDQRIAYAGPNSLILDASRTTTASDYTYYDWWLISKPITSNATIVTSDRFDPNGAQLNYDIEGDYVVRMDTDDKDRSVFDTIVYKVTTNSPPVADAGADQDVTANFPVTLSGSNSSDTDLDTVAYSWSLVSTPADWTFWPGEWPLLSEGRDASPTFTPILNGDYLFRLTVNDNQASSEADSVTISVSGSMINSAPVADAGPDQPNAIRGVQVTLDGSGSSDPDTDPITFLWHVESVPPNSMMWDGTLVTPTSEQPVFTPDVEGVYQFSLVVNDGQVDSTADTVSITASFPVINSAPIANAGPDKPNAVTGIQVALDGSGSSDPDTDPITFLWHFESVPPTSSMLDALLTTSTSEQPVFTPDVEGIYQLSLVVNDGLQDSPMDTVSVTATDLTGVCSNPLTLQTSLPYLPGIPETPTIFQIDAAAVDTIRLVSINDPSAITIVSALQASIPDLNQIAEVNFITINGNWTIFSRSHNNPVSDAVSPSFILERQSDNIFFKVDVAFTGSDAFAAVQIDSLTACRCGANAGDCP